VLRVLPGVNLVENGVEYYKPRDVGTVTRFFRANDEPNGEERFNIVWKRTGATSWMRLSWWSKNFELVHNPGEQRTTKRELPEVFHGSAVLAAATTTTPQPTTTIAPIARGPCYIEYRGGSASECFCQLAGNSGCAGTPCSCPHGCSGVTWTHGRSTTFTSPTKSLDCANPIALLTIPRSYFSSIQDLKMWCQAGMTELLADVLRAGFLSYQEHVQAGPVKQCINANSTVGDAWLHVRTSCPIGAVAQMSSTDGRTWCDIMKDVDESMSLASEITLWAVGGHSLPSGPPSTCKEIGCFNDSPKSSCSCKARCKLDANCCADFHSACRISQTPIFGRL